jgi:hypothetical protein
MITLSRSNNALFDQLSVGNWYQNLFFYTMIAGLVFINLYLVKTKAIKKAFLSRYLNYKEPDLTERVNTLTADLMSLKKELMSVGEELELSYVNADRLSTMLLEALDCFSTKIEFAETGYWSVNLQTGELSLSDNGMLLLGIPKEANLTLADGLRMVDEEYRSEIVNTIEEIIKSGTRYAKSYKINPQDGRASKWLKGSGNVLYSDEGVALALSGNFVLLQD